MLSAFKNFAITFLISALVFGGAAYFATRFLTETITGIFDAESSELDDILSPSMSDTSADTDTPDSTANPDDTTYADVIGGESFNMLFIVTDYQPELFDDYYPDKDALNQMENDPTVGATGILGAKYRHTRAISVLLLRVDKERQEFTYTVFPAITRVSTSSGNHTMADLYHLYGSDYIIDTVSAMTGLSVDHHFLVNITEMSDLINRMGGFSLYMTTDLYYNGVVATAEKPSDADANTLPLLYRIGQNSVDGSGMHALMVWEDYSSAEAMTKRNELLANILMEILDKLTGMPQAEFTAYYDRVCEDALADTTFTPKDLVAQMELLRAMHSEEFTVKTVDYPGRYVAATETADAYFAADLDRGFALFKNYRKVTASAD